MGRENQSQIDRDVHAIAKWLGDHSLKIALAESCTAGLIAASFGRLPGVSEVFCGSMVTYRESEKVAWLSVSERILESHTAVSQPTSDAMCQQLLVATPEAGVALAITGHLGPIVEPKGDDLDNDGICFVSFALRTELGTDRGQNSFEGLQRKKITLHSESRTERQFEAVALALRFVVECISKPLS